MEQQSGNGTAVKKWNSKNKWNSSNEWNSNPEPYVHVLYYYNNLRIMDDTTMLLNKVILLSSLANTISHGSDNNNIHTNIPLQE